MLLSKYFKRADQGLLEAAVRIWVGKREDVVAKSNSRTYNNIRCLKMKASRDQTKNEIHVLILISPGFSNLWISCRYVRKCKVCKSSAEIKTALWRDLAIQGTFSLNVCSRLVQNWLMQRILWLLGVNRVQNATAFWLICVAEREESCATFRGDNAIGLPHFRKLGTSCCWLALVKVLRSFLRCICMYLFECVSAVF